MIEKFYTVEQVAEMIDMHPKTIRKFIREGRLKANKVGKRWRITGHDLSIFTEGGENSKIVEEKSSDATFSTDEVVQTTTQKVSVSTVVDINVADMEEGSRISNMLIAVMNNKDPKYGKSTLNVQFLEKENKIRIMIWGTLQFVEAMLSTIDMLITNI